MSTRAACCTLQGAELLGKGSCWSQQPAKPFGFECRKDVRKHCSYFWFWWLFFFFPSLSFSILQLLLNLEVMTGAALSCSALRINPEHEQWGVLLTQLCRVTLSGLWALPCLHPQWELDTAMPAEPPQLTPPKCREQPGSELKYHAALLCFCF